MKKPISKTNYICLNRETGRKFTISESGIEIMKKDKGAFAKIKILERSDENGKFNPAEQIENPKPKVLKSNASVNNEEVFEVKSKNKENGNKAEQPTEEKGTQKEPSDESGNDNAGGLSQSNTIEANGGGTHHNGEIEFTELEPKDEDDID